jgi:hypothetical protein
MTRLFTDRFAPHRADRRSARIFAGGGAVALQPGNRLPVLAQRVKALDFHPLTDVTTFEDLVLFPNIVDELRDVDVRDLVPAGYGPNAPMPAVYESGGLDDLVNEPTVTNVYSGHHPTYEWTAPDPPRRLPGRLPDGQQGLHPRLTSTSNRRSGLSSPDLPFLAADATRQFRANASEDIAS